MTDAPSTPQFADPTTILPAIAQDVESHEVLMLAYMNREAFEETVATGRAVYYSRSRKRLWRKGEESGHVQHVEQVLIDCDADTILLRVRQHGAACHEGYRSCFFRELRDGETHVVMPREVDPRDVYRKPKAPKASQD